MKRITWGCDSCGKEADGAMPPFGWVEASFFDNKADKYRRYCFSSYRCLIDWATKQDEYYGAKLTDNTVGVKKVVRD